MSDIGAAESGLESLAASSDSRAVTQPVVLGHTVPVAGLRDILFRPIFDPPRDLGAADDEAMHLIA